MKALLMTNFVQVTVQPYGITWSLNAKLGRIVGNTRMPIFLGFFFPFFFLKDIHHQNNLIISAASLNIILTSIVFSSLNSKTNK